MASYQVMYWKDIPAQVKAQDESGVVKVMLSDRFSEAIDAAAMAEGSIDSNAYLEGWDWSLEHTRVGSARAVADSVAAELEQAYPEERLAELIRRHKS